MLLYKTNIINSETQMGSNFFILVTINRFELDYYTGLEPIPNKINSEFEFDFNILLKKI